MCFPLQSTSFFCPCEVFRETWNFHWLKLIYHWRSFLCGNCNYKRNLPLFPLNFGGRCIFGGHLMGKQKSAFLLCFPLQSASCFCLCEVFRHTWNFHWIKLIYHWRSFLCGNFNCKRNLPLFPLNFRGRYVSGGHLMGKQKSAFLVCFPLQTACCFCFCEVVRHTWNFCWLKLICHWGPFLCGNFNYKRNLPLFPLNFGGRYVSGGHLMRKQKSAFSCAFPCKAHLALVFVKFSGKRETFTD